MDGGCRWPPALAHSSTCGSLAPFFAALNEELLARLNRSGRAWAVPHRAAGGELLLLQPTPALADGAESWAQVSTSKSRGYHGLDAFGTLATTAMLGPHAQHRCTADDETPQRLGTYFLS